MKILKIEKDRVRIELTKENIDLIQFLSTEGLVGYACQLDRIHKKSKPDQKLIQGKQIVDALAIIYRQLHKGESGFSSQGEKIDLNKEMID